MVAGGTWLLFHDRPPVSEAPTPKNPERPWAVPARTMVGADAREAGIAATPATPATPETPPRGGMPDRSPRAMPEAPYRYIGRTGEGPDAAIVLFGQGRTVTLSGPGRIDDEHVAEAVSADHVVVRHLPSGAGAFLMLTPPQAGAAAGQDPEQFPRD